MDYRELLNILKNEFPKNAENIKEIIELLQISIEETIESIHSESNKYYTNKDYERMNYYADLIQEFGSIEDKLDEIIKLLYIDDNEVSNIDNKKVHKLTENFTNTKPEGFKLGNSRYISVSSWIDMLSEVSKILILKDENKFINFENISYMNGDRRKYFSQNKDDLRQPMSIMNKIYIEKNLSAIQITNIIIDMLNEYDIDESEMKIYLRKENTDLNRK